MPGLTAGPMRLVGALAVCMAGVSALRLQKANGTGEPTSFEDLKKSVVRITTYKTEWHWSRPYDSHTVAGSTGSGFFISMDPPTLATCAHVVDNAGTLYVQIPEYGQTKFPATVSTICNDADVAILQLSDHASVMATLKEAGASIMAMTLADKTPTLGSNVVASGFPLGQNTLKLSTGVVSGVDHVEFHYTNLAIQSTAIISGGNSGSPLVDQETKQVIALNYARNPSEAQINYAVPLWRLRQVIAKHQQVVNDPSIQKPYQFKVVEHGLVLTPGLDAFYLRSGGGKGMCQSGPLISEIMPRSPFLVSKPPIKADDFLVSVDGVKLDRYGQGEKSEYIEELVNFDDLIWMRTGTGEQDLVFEVCDSATGETKKHTVNMAWDKKVQGSGVRYVYEPRVEKVEWEIFGDLMFMDLTENHIDFMSGEYHSWALVRYLDPRQVGTPHLAVMLHNTGGDAEDALALSTGSLAIVDTINGHPVSSLKEFRERFQPEALQSFGNTTTFKRASADDLSKLKTMANATHATGFVKHRDMLAKGEDFLWNIRTTMGNEFAMMFVDTLDKQVKQANSKPDQAYLMTSCPLDGALKLSLMPLSLVQSQKAQLYRGSSGSPPEDVKLAAGPLLTVKREGSVSIVDFPKGEDYMEE